MPASRIFVSYAHTGDARGAEVARQLINDLRTSNAEVVADSENISDEQFMTFLSRELPKCHYLIFIQTQVSLKSLRVQTAVNMALTMVTQHRMQGVLRLLASPEGIDEQPLWIAPRTFDASSDYARARDKLFLELELIRLDANDSLLMRFPAGTSQMPTSGSGNLAAQPMAPPGSNAGPPSLYSGPLPATRPAGPPNYGAAPFQASGPMPAASFAGPSGGSGSRPLQPSGKIASPGPVPQPTPYGGVMASSALQPTPFSRPLAAPPGSAPLPPPRSVSGPFGEAGPASLPGSAFSNNPEDDRPVPLKSRNWLKLPALFSRPFKTYQTRLAAQPSKKANVAEMETLLEDRPLPLDTTRQKIIRWSLVGVIVVAVVLGTTLTVLQIRNRQVSGIQATPTTGLLATATPLPTGTATQKQPTPSSTQGNMVVIDPASTIDIYAGGKLAFKDDLASDNGVSHWHLSTGSPTCQFANKAYDVLVNSPGYCLADKSNFTNFDYQVQIKIVQGNAGGLVFRANNDAHTYYYFMITTDGHLSLWRSDANNTTPVLVPKTSAFAAAIQRGLNKPNVLAVSANGKAIVCYINKVPMITIREGTYTAGSIGVMVGMPKQTGKTEATYQYARVWTLG